MLSGTRPGFAFAIKIFAQHFIPFLIHIFQYTPEDNLSTDSINYVYYKRQHHFLSPLSPQKPSNVQ